MTPFRALDGIACPLPLANIDTDQLIAARFMSRPRTSGYGDYLLHALRFDADGAPRADCPLNMPRYAGASAMVALRNFGSGSSREAAVYALIDFGIRCVIAPSFGDIFAANAVNNGLLPAVVGEADAVRLLAALETYPTIRIDLQDATITVGNEVVTFRIDPVWRMKLINGWDDLDLTASYGAEIAAFQARDAELRPWVAIAAQS
jgi:3-isopropylmalate/(R)-2-methylmalate dehydratase small subunit